MNHCRKLIAGGLLAFAGWTIFAADRVAAKVNGEPIYEKEVEYAMPEGSFFTDKKAIIKIRLERLIRQRIIARILKTNHISVSKDEIDRRWAEREKTSPSAGCACCNYPTLKDYLNANCCRPEEYRQELALEIGYEKYMEDLWRKAYPSASSVQNLLNKAKPEILQEFTKASHIFINVVQKPDFRAEPEKTRQAAKFKADLAWQRLQKGESFAKVANEMSEDVHTKDKGGTMPCVPIYAYPFGNDFAGTLKKLKPGEYSKPIESPWGYHIIRRETINDDDLIAVLKETFIDDNWNRQQEKAVEEAQIERTPGLE